MGANGHLLPRQIRRKQCDLPQSKSGGDTPFRTPPGSPDCVLITVVLMLGSSTYAEYPSSACRTYGLHGVGSNHQNLFSLIGANQPVHPDDVRFYLF